MGGCYNTRITQKVNKKIRKLKEKNTNGQATPHSKCTRSRFTNKTEKSWEDRHIFSHLQNNVGNTHARTDVQGRERFMDIVTFRPTKGRKTFVFRQQNKDIHRIRRELTFFSVVLLLIPDESIKAVLSEGRGALEQSQLWQRIHTQHLGSAGRSSSSPPCTHRLEWGRICRQ